MKTNTAGQLNKYIIDVDYQTRNGKASTATVKVCAENPDAAIDAAHKKVRKSRKPAKIDGGTIHSV